MPKVPDRPLSKGETRKSTIMFVCMRGNKPLPKEDEEQLDKYIAFRKARHEKEKRKRS